MENLNQKSIDTLNNLLEINNDRIEGYTHASKATNEIDLKHLFTQFTETSYSCKQELASEVRKLGGIPVQGTRTTGKLYRAWMDIKVAITNKNRKAILNSCEFGEDIALKNYEDALKDNPFGSHFHSLIIKQYIMIRADHDELKTLRDALVSVKSMN